MKINKYRAKSLKAAIEKARADLGPEAKVLHVKQLDVGSPTTRNGSGGEIEIIAAVDANEKTDPSTAGVQTYQASDQQDDQAFGKSLGEEPETSFLGDRSLKHMQKKAGASYASHRKMMPENLQMRTGGISEEDAAESDSTERSGFLRGHHSIQQRATESRKAEKPGSQKVREQVVEGRVSNRLSLSGPSVDHKQDTLRDNRRILGTLHECCSKNQVNDDITYEILSLLSDNQPPIPRRPGSSFSIDHSSGAMTPRDYLATFMNRQIDVSGGLDLSQRTTVLIGPTGVGKTTTLAKLAAQYRFQQGMAVGLISIDAYRIAAIDQLKTYAQIMSMPLKVALTPEELARCIDDYEDMDLILVDTPGRSQFNTDGLRALSEFLEAAQPADTHLLVALTTKESDAYAVAENFTPQYVRQIIFTKLDETSSFGSILNICRMIGKPVSYLTTGQNVPDDIEAAQVERMVNLFLN